MTWAGGKRSAPPALQPATHLPHPLMRGEHPKGPHLGAGRQKQRRQRGRRGGTLQGGKGRVRAPEGAGGSALIAEGAAYGGEGDGEGQHHPPAPPAGKGGVRAPEGEEGGALMRGRWQQRRLDSP